MSGGGNQVMRGAMSSKKKNKNASTDAITEEELQTLQKELEESEGQLREVKDSKKSFSADLDKLKGFVETTKKEKLPKLEMDMEALSARHKELNSKRIPSLKKHMEEEENAEDLQKAKKLSSKLKQLQKEVEEVTSDAANLQQAVDELKEKISSIGGTKMQNQRNTVEEISKQIQELSSKITSAKVQIKTGKKNIEKSEQEISDCEKELEKAREEQSQIEEQEKQLHDLSSNAKNSFENAENSLTEKENSLKQISSEYNSLKKIVSEKKSADVDILNQLDDLSHLIKEFENESDKCARLHVALEKRKQGLWKILQPLHSHENNQETKEKRKSQKVGEEKGKEELQKDSEGKDGDKEEDIEEFEDNSKEKESLLPIYSPQQLSRFDKKELKKEIALLEEQTNNKSIHAGAIQEYIEKDRQHREKLRELHSVKDKMEATRRKFDELRKKRLDEFMSGFSAINLKLKEMYQMITLGGDAELELVDSLDPFSEGIVFTVKPPKKSWKAITNLSGGEKTLASLSLVFALHHYKPTPLYVMDEIDAALDFRNVSIVANYIKERTRDAQFIVISLRNNMFEIADRLVGIYKTNNCTGSVTINPTQFAIQAESN